jgi:hypothetical protein
VVVASIVETGRPARCLRSAQPRLPAPFALAVPSELCAFLHPMLLNPGAPRPTGPSWRATAPHAQMPDEASALGSEMTAEFDKFASATKALVQKRLQGIAARETAVEKKEKAMAAREKELAAQEYARHR